MTRFQLTILIVVLGCSTVLVGEPTSATDNALLGSSEKLLLAVVRDDLQEIAAALERGVDPSHASKGHVTPLEAALLRNEKAVVELLYKRRSKDLFYAIAVENNGNLQRAVDENSKMIDAELPGEYRLTPLVLSVRLKRFRSAMLILNGNVEVNRAGWRRRTPLHFAAEGDSVELLEELMKRGARVRDEDEERLRPIHLAAARGSLRVLKYLANADPNGVRAVDRNGLEPLDYAVAAKRGDCVDFLLMQSKFTPDELASRLFAAVSENDERSVSLLVAAKASQKQLGVYRRYPIHVAAQQASPLIIKKLCQSGADVNAVDRDGLTPLHLAVVMSRPEAAEALLDMGADESKANSGGITPLELARDNAREAVLRVLEGGKRGK